MGTDDGGQAMKPRVLLVNPPIYDFTAYDFWLKPLGLLRVAGQARGRVETRLFDFLDRKRAPDGPGRKRDDWGRGPFPSEEVEKPLPLRFVPRRYRRFGIPSRLFEAWLASEGPFDFALVSTSMTYWYEGVAEVVESLRRCSPSPRIALGGTYASLCPDHARGLGADLVVEGSDLGPLWAFTGIEPETGGKPLWDVYPGLDTGVLRLTVGCPFRCTYCHVPSSGISFRGRDLDSALDEFDGLVKLGAGDVAFYDDALLVDAEEILVPFLEGARARERGVRLHTPNALHARLVNEDVAKAMVRGGVESFFIGFESRDARWRGRTGDKVEPGALERAVGNLRGAGVDADRIVVYLILGHPLIDMQDLEGSIRFAHQLGVRTMLSEFSPVPGTPDFERAEETADLSEPLLHNKTAFPVALLGADEVNRIKDLSHSLNRQMSSNH